MFAQYNADCKDYICQPSSDHYIATSYGAVSVPCVVTTGSNTTCPLTNPPGSLTGNFPTGFGWFYWMGYLPPVAPNRPVGIMDCPDIPTFRTYGYAHTWFEEKTYNEFSRYTTVLANQSPLNGVNPQGGGSTWDCNVDAQSRMGYVFRGWQQYFWSQGNVNPTHAYPRASSWKTNQSVLVDDQYNDGYYGKMMAAHDNGLNILFADAHVSFGGKDINYPAAGLQTAIKPFIYYSMFINGYSYANAIANSDAGYAYAGSKGSQYLWDYYSTGIQ